MARTLKPGGLAIVTAPASLGALFTDGTPAETLLARIENALREQTLAELKELYRATFALRDGRLTLVANGAELSPGEQIWRKLPGLAVPNRYHPEAVYLDEFLAAGFAVKRIDRPRLTKKKPAFATAISPTTPSSSTVSKNSKKNILFC